MNWPSRLQLDDVELVVWAVAGTITVAATWYALRRRIVDATFVLVVTAAFLAVHLVGPLTRRYGPVATELTAARLSFLCLVSLCVSLVAALNAFDPLRSARESFRLPLISPGRVCATCFAVGAAGLVVGIAAQRGSLTDALEAGRFELRGSANPVVSVVAQQTTRLLLPAVLLLPLAVRRWSAPSRLAAYLVPTGLALALFIVSKGSRSLPVGVLGAFALGITLRHHDRARLTARGAVRRAVITSVIVVWVLVGAYDARRFITTDGVASSLRVFAEAPVRILDFEREPLDYHEITIQAIDVSDEFRPALLSPVRRLVFAPLPSGGLKPPDLNAEFAQAIGRRESVTVPPSIPGEGLLTFGHPFGVVLWGSLYGLCAAGLVIRSRRSVAVRLALLASAFEIGLLTVRGQFYEVAVSIVSMVLLLSIVLRRLGDTTRIPRAGPASSGSTGGDALEDGELERLAAT